MGTNYFGVGVGIGVGIEKVLFDPDFDSEPFLRRNQWQPAGFTTEILA
jgi:hypothetical protein